MILLKYNDSDTYYEVSFKRQANHLVEVYHRYDAPHKTCGFKMYDLAGNLLGNFGKFTTIYVEPSENEVWFSSDGSVFVPPEEKEPEPPTLEDIKQELINGVQMYMDEVAASRGYDNIFTVCTYIDTGVERFDIEGAKARRWRSAVWEFCYAYLDDVLAGKKAIPTSSELIEQLPKIQW